MSLFAESLRFAELRRISRQSKQRTRAWKRSTKLERRRGRTRAKLGVLVKPKSLPCQYILIIHSLGSPVSPYEQCGCIPDIEMTSNYAARLALLSAPARVQDI
jgi:hypothetical protein